MKHRGPRSTHTPTLERLEPRHLLAAAPIITEFMASNSGEFRDGDDRTSDWIEIHNAGDESIDLLGHRLTDDAQQPDKWIFPSRLIAPGEYLVVFASSQAESSYVDSNGFLHTTFALRRAGEYLGMSDPAGNLLSEFRHDQGGYPEQRANVSYGLTQIDAAPLGYFDMPTPGRTNSTTAFEGLVAEPQFSVGRGFYDDPFSVELSSTTPDAVIIYTTDGSAPNPENGDVYDGPVQVDTTTTLRAVASKPNHLPSEVETTTYIFAAHVIRQDGAGLPTTWGRFPNGSTEAERNSPVPANYEMDPDVVNDPRYRDTIRDDLKSLPIVSLTMDPLDLWDEERGIYSNTTRRGQQWERPASVELFQPDGTTEFQVNAGVRIHGGFGRRPAATAKHSLRLLFKGEYGPTELEYPWFGADEVDQFDTIVLRANYNYSWSRGNRGGSQTGKDYTMITDRWGSVAQDEMGGLSPNGTFVHLYLNGLYWGVYNPNERPDGSFLAEHLGGRAGEFDVMSHDGLESGTRDAWRELETLVRQRPVDLAAVEELLDLDNFIDYMILNQFGGNGDWPQNNWYASRRRGDGQPWQFHMWDAEFFFINVNDNRITSIPAEGPGNLYLRLRRDPEFAMRFADRIQLHFFNGGVLTPEANIARLRQLAEPLDRAVVGESARWGDAWMNQVPTPRTRDDDWIPRLNELTEDYFPRRHDVVLNQYKRARILPDLEAPQFSQFGGEVGLDFLLTIQHSDPNATIYYTTEGSDPRLPGGEVNPTATLYEGEKIILPSIATVQARAFLEDTWSPILAADFRVRADFDGDGLIGAADIDRLCSQIGSKEYRAEFDLNGDQAVDQADHDAMIRDVLGTVIGDSNLDGVFDSSDLVWVFQRGRYDRSDAEEAGWADGDWNCNGNFSSDDLVVAFAAGSYANQ